jgi:hypothetical protein
MEERMSDHNGWTNYETWNVALHIDNEQVSQAYWREQARTAYLDAADTDTFTKRENAAFVLLEILKEQFNDNAPELSGTYADMLNAALSEVNWYEIASNLINNVIEGG